MTILQVIGAVVCLVRGHTWDRKHGGHYWEHGVEYSVLISQCKRCGYEKRNSSPSISPKEIEREAEYQAASEEARYSMLAERKAEKRKSECKSGHHTFGEWKNQGLGMIRYCKYCGVSQVWND